MLPEKLSEQSLKLRVYIIHPFRLSPPSARPVHEPKCVSNHLKHCQSGAGFTARETLFGFFVTVHCLGCCTTLSALLGLGASRFPAMEAALGFAL
jgi:hypothetical protein